ncbi:unnamed protein product [Arctia plantaginis]|uniref:Uncharacterized protein n=1 Tax=Arctia plantaginis TaxID=874455 RepID=A0A8S1BSH0_ARCPL|nr:unnamed protein product [Arctia plantaginis]
MMFAWSHLDHYMDSVGQLTSQMLDLVLNYCAKLGRKVDNDESSDDGSKLSGSKPSNEIQKDAVPAEEIKEQKTKQVVLNVVTEIKKER